jgi:hypothetical protein
MLAIKLAPALNGFNNTWEYELLDDVGTTVAGQPIVVPRMFSYDGATIPSLAWKLIYTPFDPIVMAPALVHDWLYSNHQVSKEDADTALKNLLMQNGVPGDKASIIHKAVAWFGNEAWENKPNDIAYLKWLCAKLKAAGVDTRPYKFPPDTCA